MSFRYGQLRPVQRNGRHRDGFGRLHDIKGRLRAAGIDRYRRAALHIGFIPLGRHRHLDVTRSAGHRLYGQPIQRLGLRDRDSPGCRGRKLNLLHLGDLFLLSGLRVRIRNGAVPGVLFRVRAGADFDDARIKADSGGENLLAGCGNLNLLRNGKFPFLASGQGHRQNGDNHPQIQ